MMRFQDGQIIEAVREAQRMADLSGTDYVVQHKEGERGLFVESIYLANPPCILEVCKPCVSPWREGAA